MSETILFPSVPPRPGRRPSAAHQVVYTHRLAVSAWLPWVLAAVLAAGFLYDVRPGRSAPATDGVRLGRAFAPILARSLADGFEAGAELLARGRPVKEADDALKKTFFESREKAFRDHAAAAFETIVPAGSEPRDEATRRRYEALFRDFAKGLREVR